MARVEELKLRLKKEDDEGRRLAGDGLVLREGLREVRRSEQDSYYHLHKKVDDSYEVLRELEGALVERTAEREGRIEKLRRELEEALTEKESILGSLKCKRDDLIDYRRRQKDVIDLRSQLYERRSSLHAEKEMCIKDSSAEVYNEEREALRERVLFSKQTKQTPQQGEAFGASSDKAGLARPADTGAAVAACAALKVIEKKTLSLNAALASGLKEKGSESLLLVERKRILQEENQELSRSRDVHCQMIKSLSETITHAQGLVRKLQARLALNSAEAYSDLESSPMDDTCKEPASRGRRAGNEEEKTCFVPFPDDEEEEEEEKEKEEDFGGQRSDVNVLSKSIAVNIARKLQKVEDRYNWLTQERARAEREAKLAESQLERILCSSDHRHHYDSTVGSARKALIQAAADWLRQNEDRGIGSGFEASDDKVEFLRHVILSATTGSEQSS